MTGRARRNGEYAPWLHSATRGVGGSPYRGGPSLSGVRGANDERRGASNARRVCGECHFWNPDDVLPSLGECENEESARCGYARLQNDVSGDCFRVRSLANLEQCWCGRCRETIPVSEFAAHAGHGLFVGTARFTVEEMLELTVAGD